ncbi:hypothetical protein FF2_045535 [Malus domestica]
MANRSTRIAILNTDKCMPNKCNQECKRNCPPVHIAAAKSVLRLHRRPRALLSPKNCALVVVSVFTNARLKQFKSSTCQRHSTKKQPTVMGLTILSYTGYRSLGQGKFLVWSELMALGSQLPSKFCQAVRNQIWAVSTIVQIGKKS